MCLGLAILDANEAISLDPGYIKAYYRRGSANFALGKLKDARRDFKTVVKLVPSDAEANKKLKACEKAIREEAFLKAIESENNGSVAVVNIDPSQISVEDSYDGPHLSTGDSDANSNGSSSSSANGSLVSLDFVRAMISRFRDQKSIHRKYVVQMLLAAKEMFSGLPSLLRLSLSPPSSSSAERGGDKEERRFTVCGDTHGQFYDLCNIFEIGGFPSESNPYLFNGDFVDRGSFSFEVVMTLIAIKLACPSGLHMLRGNHETRNMNKIYGFEGEVRAKFDEQVMALFTAVFNWLPLAAVIQDAVFVVHGGLSTQEGGVSLGAIASVPRNREPPESGLMSELVSWRFTRINKHILT